MSAIEIYNEKVRDLLKDGTERQNLPLLDDPERGTVAEGLSEEWPRSEQHLCQLLRQIEARRTVHVSHELHTGLFRALSCETVMRKHSLDWISTQMSHKMCMKA